jgi:hypothetical protein
MTAIASAASDSTTSASSLGDGAPLSQAPISRRWASASAGRLVTASNAAASRRPPAPPWRWRRAGARVTVAWLI